jgi:hypothetical protein
MSRIPNVTKVIKNKNFHLTTFANFFCENAWDLLAQISTHRVTGEQIRLVFEGGERKIDNATFPACKRRNQHQMDPSLTVPQNN